MKTVIQKSKKMLQLAVVLLAAPSLHAAAVLLQADGPGNTYELISAVLGGSPMEVPDCSHPEFGRHITEEWDDTLGKYVFVFHIHVVPDDDRCINFDRQRNEIKTYGPSPAYLKGYYNDIHTYRWKFKLDAGFQPSPNFTHIFQIKAGDGSDSGAPIITFTPRYGTPETLQLIFTPSSGTSGGGTKAEVPLDAFKGEWVEAYVRTLYAENGTIEVLLTRVRDGAVLLSYASDNLDMWRGDATFNRPKWGIYRSLNSPEYLRDEQVRFADFCIAKGDDSCPGDVTTSELVAHLTFDDGTAEDCSGVGNHGTLVNGAAVINDSRRGSILFLDGMDDYVDLGNDASLDLGGTGQATLAAWVKPAVTKNHNSIITKGEWKDSYSLVIKGDTTPANLLWTGNDTSVFSADPVPVGVWTHVAVVIEGSLATFYVNGQQSGPAMQNRGGPIDNTAAAVCIGREQYSTSLPAGRWFFSGLIDDVQIYNKALSAADIRTIMSPADINGDGNVNMADFNYISAQWLTNGSAVPSSDIAPAGGDGVVDLYDLMIFLQYFLDSQ